MNVSPSEGSGTHPDHTHIGGSAPAGPSVSQRAACLNRLETVAQRRVAADWVVRMFVVDMLKTDKPGSEFPVLREMSRILDEIYGGGKWQIKLKWPGMRED